MSATSNGHPDVRGLGASVPNCSHCSYKMNNISNISGVQLLRMSKINNLGVNTIINNNTLKYIRKFI